MNSTRAIVSPLSLHFTQAELLQPPVGPAVPAPISQAAFPDICSSPSGVFRELGEAQPQADFSWGRDSTFHNTLRHINRSKASCAQPNPPKVFLFLVPLNDVHLISPQDMTLDLHYSILS